MVIGSLESHVGLDRMDFGDIVGFTKFEFKLDSGNIPVGLVYARMGLVGYKLVRIDCRCM